MSTRRGRFVWFDLVTTDPEAAKKFYSEVVGWNAGPRVGGEYQILQAGEHQVGGVMPLPKEACDQGGSPGWTGHIEVESADKTVEQATRLGGRLLLAPRDVPDFGRFALLADPQGAAFAVLEWEAPRQALDRESRGSFSWAELNTTDWKSAWEFYRTLFGWTATQSMNMGPEFGEYFMFGTDSQRSMGGMSDAAKMMKAPAHWLHYIHVSSTHETAKQLPQLGGQVVNGPLEVPGGDWVAQCRDPQGAYFAVYSSQRG